MALVLYYLDSVLKKYRSPAGVDIDPPTPGISDHGYGRVYGRAYGARA